MIREGILWVLTETRGPMLGRELFYLLPDSRQFRKAGDNLAAEALHWDADHTVLTTHDIDRANPVPVLIWTISLPAYPILRKDSGNSLTARMAFGSFPLLTRIVCDIAQASRSTKPSAKPR